MEVDGEEDQGKAGGEAVGHHLGFVEGLDEVAFHSGGHDALVAVVLAGGSFDVGAGDEGFVGVDGGDGAAQGEGWRLV